jgi:hypothetical protein
MRRIVVLAVATVGLSMASVQTGVAAPPVGGCPTSEWHLGASPSGGQGTQSVDQNSDGQSCFLEAPAGSGLFTVVDNVVK